MMLLEVLATPGAVEGQRRVELGERLLTELTAHDDIPPDLHAASQALWHVVLDEPRVWVTRGGAVTPHERPTYFARLSVPTGSHPLTAEMRDDYISRITRALGDANVVVHITELPDGSFGMAGRAMTIADIVELVTGGRQAAGAAPVEAGAEVAIDPVCGMTVDLTADPVLLTVDQATWAFCADACRQAFAARHGGAAVA